MTIHIPARDTNAILDVRKLTSAATVNIITIQMSVTMVKLSSEKSCYREFNFSKRKQKNYAIVFL